MITALDKLKEKLAAILKVKNEGKYNVDDREVIIWQMCAAFCAFAGCPKVEEMVNEILKQGGVSND